jgi:hypothetical protein
MINLIPFDADNVVGMRIDGRIGDEAFDQVLAAIEQKMATHDKVRLYVEMQSFGGMSMQALLKDIRFGLGHWSRFDREAIVTDKGWMKTLVPVMDKLVPGIEVKVFPSERQGDARQWVAG